MAALPPLFQVRHCQFALQTSDPSQCTTTAAGTQLEKARAGQGQDGRRRRHNPRGVSRKPTVTQRERHHKHPKDCATQKPASYSQIEVHGRRTRPTRPCGPPRSCR